MARKPKDIDKANNNIHEFTNQIHSSRRSGTRFSNMNNHNERKAKIEDRGGCRYCRYFWHGCSQYIGKYHKACNEFEWD